MGQSEEAVHIKRPILLLHPYAMDRGGHHPREVISSPVQCRRRDQKPLPAACGGGKA